MKCFTHPMVVVAVVITKVQRDFKEIEKVEAGHYDNALGHVLFLLILTELQCLVDVYGRTKNDVIHDFAQTTFNDAFHYNSLHTTSVNYITTI